MASRHPASGSLPALDDARAPDGACRVLVNRARFFFGRLRRPRPSGFAASDSAKGGRPPFDTVMMLKIVVLQALYCLSDDQAEFQIQDQLSPVGMARISIPWMHYIQTIKFTPPS
ncbi:transposase [Mesorhizobium norvegicum]|uniref:transposase n=1 Tax=Mesorhizobium norvegicum TaxID=1085774 RepID=UPI003CCC7E31